MDLREDLLEAVSLVSREKGIPVEEIFDAMEKAILRVAVSKYGSLYDIRAQINKTTGLIKIARVFTVVEEVENHYHQVTLEEAQAKNPSHVLGDEIVEYLPEPDFSRTLAQPFRQIVTSKIKEYEKEREYEKYKDQVGELVSGTVKRNEAGNVYVELSNKVEAFIRRDQCIPRENLEPGARVRAVITDVRRDQRFAQVLLSRTSPSFVTKLFKQEISEIYDGVVEIKGIAREAGSRSKIALASSDKTIDPVAITLGFKGSKIQGILSELKGEKLDLIHFSENVGTYAMNAFHTVDVKKLIIDEEKKYLEVVIKEEDLSLAIGRKGQNINLISSLLGYHIDLISEEKEKEKREEETQQRIAYFKEAISVDDVIAQILTIEGFESVESILQDEGASLSEIEEFNEEIIEEILERCNEYIANKEKSIIEELNTLGVSEDLINFHPSLTKDVVLKLAHNDIKNLSDFADLSVFEFLDIDEDKKIDKALVEELIMQAREKTS